MLSNDDQLSTDAGMALRKAVSEFMASNPEYQSKIGLIGVLSAMAALLAGSLLVLMPEASALDFFKGVLQLCKDKPHVAGFIS